MYATTEQEFNHEWDVLQQDYTADFPFVMIYLADNLIPRKRKFVSFWTNQRLHFNNRATSRGESNNSKLKKQLGGSSIGKYSNLYECAR